MSISNVTEDAILRLVYTATAWANYADNAASAPQSNIGISLHNADPTDGGTANSNEVTYSGYIRRNVARLASAWMVSGGVVNPVLDITFPQSAGSAATASFFATAKSNGNPPVGALPILWSGIIVPSIPLSSGITPRLTNATTITLD